MEPCSTSDVPSISRAVVEKPFRSLIKAISWRVTGTIDTIVVSLVITRQLKWAISIGAIELFTKITLYYLHERAWARIALGRVLAPPPDFEI